VARERCDANTMPMLESGTEILKCERVSSLTWHGFTRVNVAVGEDVPMAVWIVLS
jgi:hypothetical protein